MLYVGVLLGWDKLRHEKTVSCPQGREADPGCSRDLPQRLQRVRAQVLSEHRVLHHQHTVDVRH